MKKFSYPKCDYIVGCGRDMQSLIKNLRAKTALKWVMPDGEIESGIHRGYAVNGEALFVPVNLGYCDSPELYKVWAVKIDKEWDMFYVIDATDVAYMLMGVVEDIQAPERGVIAAEKQADNDIWVLNHRDEWECELEDVDNYDFDEEV